MGLVLDVIHWKAWSPLLLPLLTFLQLCHKEHEIMYEQQSSAKRHPVCGAGKELLSDTVQQVYLKFSQD